MIWLVRVKQNWEHRNKQRHNDSLAGHQWPQPSSFRNKRGVLISAAGGPRFARTGSVCTLGGHLYNLGVIIDDTVDRF